MVVQRQKFHIWKHWKWDIDKFEEVEGVVDPEFKGLHHQTWVDLDNLPENILPKGLTKILKDDYKKGFPRQGEYLGIIN